MSSSSLSRVAGPRCRLRQTCGKRRSERGRSKGIWVEGRGLAERHVGVDHIHTAAEVPWWAIHVDRTALKRCVIDTVVVGDWYSMTRTADANVERSVDDERFPFWLTLGVSDLGAHARRHPELEIMTVLGPGNVDAELLTEFPSLKQLSISLDGDGVDRCGGLGRLVELRELELDGVFALDVDALPETWPALRRVTIRGGRKTWSAALKRKLAGVPSVTITGLKDDTWIAENLACPFRTWEHASPALARGAIKAWKEARRRLAELGPSAGSRAEPALKKLVDDLNRLDARHDIESAERDHAATVFVAMADEHGVSRRDAEAWFEAWRRF